MTFRWSNGQYCFERIPLSQNFEYREAPRRSARRRRSSSTRTSWSERVRKCSGSWQSSFQSFVNSSIFMSNSYNAYDTFSQEDIIPAMRSISYDANRSAACCTMWAKLSCVFFETLPTVGSNFSKAPRSIKRRSKRTQGHANLLQNSKIYARRASSTIGSPLQFVHSIAAGEGWDSRYQKPQILVIPVSPGKAKQLLAKQISSQ
jgi:hypothetical protein